MVTRTLEWTLWFCRSGLALGIGLVLAVASCVAFPPSAETDLSKGREPPQRFFVLVASPQFKQGLEIRPHHRLSELRAVKSYSFLLPDRQGALSIGESIKVSYRAEAAAPGVQNVEVTYTDEESVKAISRYRAQANSITPLYSKVWHPMMGIWYVFIAIAAWAILWLVSKIGLTLLRRSTSQ